MANNLRVWDPFAGLSSMHSQIDDLFNSFFGAGSLPVAQSAPAMDVYTEGDKALVAEVQAPGFSKDDIEVNVHNGMLEIKGEKHQKDDEKDGKRSYMVRESHASFYRSVALPKGADSEDVKASFDEGVLKVKVGLKPLPQPKKVAIESGKQ